MLHHHFQESDDDFGAGTQEYLTLASLLSIVDTLQSISEYIHAHHFCRSHD